MFLERGINVFAYNYRAYGRSSGKPTPEKLKIDIWKVYLYLREKLQLSGKIGIYGRSLGGIPASFLSNSVQMAIFDRSFSNLTELAQSRSPLYDFLFKIGSCGWQSYSDYYIQNYQLDPAQANSTIDIEMQSTRNSTSCYKVIAVDKKD